VQRAARTEGRRGRADRGYDHRPPSLRARRRWWPPKVRRSWRRRPTARARSS